MKRIEELRVETNGRREFVFTLATAAAGSALSFLPGASMAKNFGKHESSLSAQDIINLILKSIPNAPFPATVDTIKAGDPQQKVTGIVTTMFATIDIIEKAAKIGANFIIAHEPTFYNHTDKTDWLENDEVYRYKSELLKRHKMVVWRFHDYIHAHNPDGVMMGVLTAMGWQQYYDAAKPNVVTLPEATFGSVISLVKSKLKISHVRVIGNLSQPCSKVVIAPGSAGGTRQIEAIRKEKPDVFICGELNEWETSEYIRDLQRAGGKTSLIVLGHIVSEEPGLEWLVTWLQPQIPAIKVTHISSQDAFTWV